MDRDTVIRTLVSDRARLLAYVWSMVRDDHASEDLFQDVVVAAMNKVATFEDRLHVLKWSRVTLRNKALEYLRKKRTVASVLAADVLDGLDDHWEEQDEVAVGDVTDALRQCLTSLTDNARSLVEMRYQQGMRGTEIAESTGKPAHTIYVALSRAYKALGDCIRGKMASTEAGHA